jgi:hypothetical protein
MPWRAFSDRDLSFYPTMNPEEIQALEDQAAKGNPEACVKLSFHLISTDSSNPESVKRAGALNQKAVEKFKDRLVQSIGKTSTDDADMEAASKLHLGILYELGRVGIKREPLMAFRLIQDALGLRGGFEGNPYFPETNALWSGLESFGYGIYPNDTVSWKQVAALSERVDKLQAYVSESMESLNELNPAELDLIVKDCIGLVDSGECCQDAITEVLYIKSRARFLHLGVLVSRKVKSQNKFNYISSLDLVGFLASYLPGAVLAAGGSLIFEVDNLNGRDDLCLIYNQILSDLERSAHQKNGKSTMEIARLWDHLAERCGDDHSEFKKFAFDQARNYYSRVAELGCAYAFYHLGDLIRSLPQDAHGLGLRYLKIGADMLGPIKTNSFHLPGTLRHSHIGDQLAACSSFDIAERWKFYHVSEDPGCYLEDEVFWSASRAERAEAVLRFEIWNKSTEFISRLRRNKPLSCRVESAEYFKPMETFSITERPRFMFLDENVELDF